MDLKINVNEKYKHIRTFQFAKKNEILQIYQHAHKNKGQLFTAKKTYLNILNWSIFEENPNAQPLIM